MESGPSMITWAMLSTCRISAKFGGTKRLRDSAKNSSYLQIDFQKMRRGDIQPEPSHKIGEAWGALKAAEHMHSTQDFQRFKNALQAELRGGLLIEGLHKLQRCEEGSNTRYHASQPALPWILHHSIS